jgi:hypothetical protein
MSGHGGGWAPIGSSESWCRGGGSLAGACLVSRMPEDGRAVAEVKVRGLAPVGVSESGAVEARAQQPGRRPRRGGRAGGVCGRRTG